MKRKSLCALCALCELCEKSTLNGRVSIFTPKRSHQAHKGHKEHKEDILSCESLPDLFCGIYSSVDAEFIQLSGE
jgi:hypothetical protein